MRVAAEDAIQVRKVGPTTNHRGSTRGPRSESGVAFRSQYTLPRRTRIAVWGYLPGYEPVAVTRWASILIKMGA